MGNTYFQHKWKNNDLYLDKNVIRFNNKEIYTQELNGFFYCTLDMSFNLARSLSHSIHFRDMKNNKIHIGISGGTFSNKQKLHDNYNLILKAIYNIIIPDYLVKVARSILKGEDRKIGDSILTSSGVKANSGLTFFKKAHFIEYADIIFFDEPGIRWLSSRFNTKIISKIDLLKDWYSSVIENLTKILKESI